MKSNLGQDLLFVYGTLHPAKAPPEIADVVAQMKSLGRGTIQGVRYELGPYPAVVFDAGRDGAVAGELFILPSDPEALKRLDAYEDYNPDDLKTSLYHRVQTVVTLNNGSEERCWVYVYNQPISPGLKSTREAVAS